MGFGGFGGGGGGVRHTPPEDGHRGGRVRVCVRGHWGRVSNVSGLMLDGARSISKFC